MMFRSLSLAAAFSLSLCLGAAPAWGQQAPSTAGAPPDGHVTSTIIRGAQAYPTNPVLPSATHPGDVNLNFPAADVRDLSKAVLGDMLGLTFTVEPGVSGSVTLVTAQPIARGDVLRAFEDALRASNLALLRRGGAYVVAPLAEARGQAGSLGAGEIGFGSETIQLHYIAAAELKRLLDPVAPDTLSVADPTRNIITVTGAAGQRQSVRELIAQFDVDWLKGMSFGLYVTQHTDSRILVPEIDKLLNGEGAPSAGLVRLIAMEKINGVLAISSQPQYLDDVKRWIEVLDREGESNERRLYVYRVQNGRSSDLADVLNTAFGASPSRSGSGVSGAANASANGASAASNAAAIAAVNNFAPPPPALTGSGSRGSASGGQGGAGDARGGQITASISSDETNNAVVAFATPREFAVIEDALRKLDVAPLQVLIEAAITEVDLNHNLQYGVQWSFSAGGSTYGVASPASTSTTTTNAAGASVTTPTQGFNWTMLNNGSISAQLNALSTLTKVNVLSAPKLLVLNNHTASLEVGDQVPVVTGSAVSTVGSNSPIVNSVDYKDTGVILKVTPRVNSGGLVLLDIAQEVSDVITTSSSTINSPTIQQRKFASSIAIQDGQTVVLGGLIRDSATKGRAGVPYLSAIPGLGALFGQQTTADVRTELLIMLTPRVIRSTVDADAVTEELKRKIQAIEPLKPVNSVHP